MRTTKKLVSAVLAGCMLASTGIASSFAATMDASSTAASNTQYVSACEAIDSFYTYDEGDLGATYSPEQTVFKVWSPKATEVKLNLYATGSDEEEGAENLGTYDLKKQMSSRGWNGVWTVTVEGDLKNVYYTYSITAVPTFGSTEPVTNETQDVYSVATGVNGLRSMVCDLDSTDPEGWEDDQHVLLDEVTDSSVWEIHVKDFSYDPASGVSEENRGKYLAFTESGTTLNGEGNISTCVDYLVELGITTVQINPFYDYESVNEASDDDSLFNWGYDPMNYNVPEGSYSTNPYDGNVRINECKQMIQALHNAGISVVMDVVYNHTYKTDSCFQKTVPNYYYRMTDDGAFSNGSGCGNECATERAMYRNYMIQSVKYWVEEYHIDGFRFDLMGLMDGETMNLVRDELDMIDERISTWGEGWTGGTSYAPAKTCTGEPYYQTIQSNAAKISDRMAFFNDCIRDGIKGGTNIGKQGFVQGSNASGPEVAAGIRANTTRNRWQANAPSQCVTYAACHDNATLYDQLLGSTGLAPYGERNSEAIKMNKLAGAIVYTSQGIAFMLAGEEMCRTKFGDTNSYKSPADINMINWNDMVEYADVISYYKGLMQIRNAFTPLTCMDNTYKGSYSFNLAPASSMKKQIAFTITNDQEGEWNKMAVIYNSDKVAVDVTLKDKTVTDWVIIANGEEAGYDNLGEVQGSTFTVPARSAIIAVDKQGYNDAALESGMGKVIVNYIHQDSGEKLDDTIVLKGNYGTKYMTTPSSCVPDTYELVADATEGSELDTFTDSVENVTYYYVDYVPESVLAADFNNDEKINILDVTEMQKHLAKIVTFDDEKLTKFDLDYNGANNILDCTMLQKHLAKMPVSTGTVTVNHYYYDGDELKNLTASETITGRVGSDYSTSDFKVVGYSVDLDNYPEKASSVIPYGGNANVNYYYKASSLDINLHFKHNGAETWAPTLWIWGSDLKGVDKYNYTPNDSAVWPGVNAADDDGDGWFDYNFTYRGAGTYNVIVSNNAANQTIDYKGFVDNEMWVVIDDGKLTTGTFLTFYTDNPDLNPDAPIANQIVLG